MPFTTLGYHALKSFVHIFQKFYGRCPNCGKKLIMRKGKYGKFIGCSNYSRCKYTKNLGD